MPFLLNRNGMFLMIGSGRNALNRNAFRLRSRPRILPAGRIFIFGRGVRGTRPRLGHDSAESGINPLIYLYPLAQFAIHRLVFAIVNSYYQLPFAGFKLCLIECSKETGRIKVIAIGGFKISCGYIRAVH